ncbi:hypothetical protein ABMA79_03685 [Halobacteriovorax sp. HFRX-2_2]|uniref:hypothetical protein n=1 Tax=unclassified Halobacteriovorax TaxID=2639665 RepID=UPI0037233C37
MKLVIALFVTLSAFANTYQLSNTVASEASYDYKALETITLTDVEHLNSDIFARTVTFRAVFNGELKSFTGKIVEREVVGSDYLYKVQGSLDRDVVANGYRCDEFEAFNYVFDAQLEVNFEAKYREVKITKVSLLREYSYDICHDRKESTITPYILK